MDRERNTTDDRRHIAFFQKAMGGGGAERMVAMLASGYAARGHRVDLVLGSPRGPMLDNVSAEVRIVDLAARRARASAPAVLRLPGTIREMLPRLILKGRPRVMACLMPLVDYLERERPEALLSTFGYNGLVAIWARQLAGVSTRVVVREANPLSERLSSGGKAEVRWLPRLIAEWYPKAECVVAVTDGVRDDLERTANLPPGLVRTIYNGVDVDRIALLAAEPVAHPWLASRNGVPVVLAVGRLKTQKDHTTLLRAFSGLRKRRQAKLVILGEGKERAKLEALVAELALGEDVDLPGFVKNPYAFMARADLFVLTSRWEGAANVLIEALATGCRIVSTDCPSGPAEILEGGLHGRLVPVEDAEALRVAMDESIAESPDPARARSRAQEFSVDRSLDQYLEALLPGQ